MFGSNLLSPRYLDPKVIERIVEPLIIQESFENYLSDESKIKGDIPLSISFPKSVEELSSLLTENFKKVEPTTFSGARSGVVGGAVPFGKSHLVSIERMRGVLTVSQDEKSGEFSLRALSGTPLSEINSHLAEHHPDLFYPVDPTYQHGAIGGNVSTNAGGARSYFYGPTRKWVKGLTVVLSDGGILCLRRGDCSAKNGELTIEANGGVRTLSGQSIRVPKTKHAIGYHYNESVDVIDMLIGSEGTLAGIAEVEVRLTTRPKNRLYFTQFFDSVDTAFDFATSVQRIGLSILALEFVDQNSIKIISNCAARQSCKTIQSIKPNDSAAVFLDITYDNPSDLEDIYEKLQTELDSFGVDTSRSLAGTEDRDLQDFKVFRHAIPENINALVASRKKDIPSLYKISTDMSVNPEKLKEIFDFYNMTLSQMKIDHFIFGHFGDAHLHLNVVPNSLEQLNKFQSIYAEFAKKVVQCGGAVAGEHGIGRVKKHFLPIQYNSEELEQLKLIKSFFDPNWLLNPGVLIDR